LFDLDTNYNVLIEGIESKSGGQIAHNIVCQDMETSKALFKLLKGAVRTVNLEHLKYMEISGDTIQNVKD